MMKKLIMLLSLVTIFSIAACGSPEEDVAQEHIVYVIDEIDEMLGSEYDIESIDYHAYVLFQMIDLQETYFHHAVYDIVIDVDGTTHYVVAKTDETLPQSVDVEVIIYDEPMEAEQTLADFNEALSEEAFANQVEEQVMEDETFDYTHDVETGSFSPSDIDDLLD